jgi:sirohydrochlorin cobaltochelatase
MSERFLKLQHFASDQGGLLIVGHGTRLREGQGQLLSLVQGMQQQLPHVAMTGCFLELAQPDIEAGLRQLQSQGIIQILIVPILLFTAAHAKDDIPNAVHEAAQQLELKVVGQSDALQHNEIAILLSQLRAHQAAACTNAQGCNQAGFCDQAITCTGTVVEETLQPSQLVYTTRLNDIALVTIGRGTSDDDARQAMRQFCAIRCESLQPAWSTVGFFAGDAVTVEAAFEQAASQSECQTILVQPHLLFEGHLTHSLRKTVDDFRKAYPQKRWLCAMSLGCDNALGNAYLSLAEAALGIT